MPKKTFIPLGPSLSPPQAQLTISENNPEVFTHLAHNLGLSPQLHFEDVFSFEPDVTSLIPRPVHALLLIIPMTPTWQASRVAENLHMSEYTGYGPDEPVIWFKQTSGHACGSIGLLHCVLNGSAAAHLQPGSTLADIRERALPLRTMERAKVLEESKELERAHKEAATMGDTVPPGAEAADKLGFHFVAFVKGADGALYELEGGSGRKGPLKRGRIGNEDLLSPKALEIGIGRLLAMDGEAGDMRFSCIALVGERG